MIAHSGAGIEKMPGFWFPQLIQKSGTPTLKTFDQVISDKLNAMSHASERSQYYQLLLGNDSGQMYGNHQTLRNIFGSASIHEYTAVNGFGYDMQAWNTTHCNISDLHEGVRSECQHTAVCTI